MTVTAVREDLLWRGILPIIPPKANRREPPACDFRRYRDRNHVERLFNGLEQSRRIATRYDKTAASFLGFLSLAAAKLWLTDYVNRTSIADRVRFNCFMIALASRQPAITSQQSCAAKVFQMRRMHNH
ncbi:transposase [Sphingobium sp. D43FB]|uniref:transposase n=1 Tax=Sphingobium sp. D43FB TaxID=2017595 RepID=UPI0020D1961D|nr:transposase [Sphingobium sp. D43FB]